MTKIEALQTILSDKKSWATSLNYAINYIKTAISIGEDHPEFDTLVIRLLGNMTKWRHPQAKEVRKVLRS